MPKFSTMSQYLRASDLTGHDDKIVTIRSFTEESLRQGPRQAKKWVLQFDELEGGLALNAGNGKVISELYGEEMDGWIDKKVALYVDPHVEFNGEQVSGIRVRPRAIANGF